MPPGRRGQHGRHGRDGRRRRLHGPERPRLPATMERRELRVRSAVRGQDVLGLLDEDAGPGTERDAQRLQALGDRTIASPAERRVVAADEHLARADLRGERRHHVLRAPDADRQPAAARLERLGQRPDGPEQEPGPVRRGEAAVQDRRIEDEQRRDRRPAADRGGQGGLVVDRGGRAGTTRPPRVRRTRPVPSTSSASRDRRRALGPPDGRGHDGDRVIQRGRQVHRSGHDVDVQGGRTAREAGRRVVDRLDRLDHHGDGRRVHGRDGAEDHGRDARSRGPSAASSRAARWPRDRGLPGRPADRRPRRRRRPARAARRAASRRGPADDRPGHGRHRRSGRAGGGPSRSRRVPRRHRAPRPPRPARSPRKAGNTTASIASSNRWRRERVVEEPLHDVDIHALGGGHEDRDGVAGGPPTGPWATASSAAVRAAVAARAARSMAGSLTCSAAWLGRQPSVSTRNRIAAGDRWRPRRTADSRPPCGPDRRRRSAAPRRGWSGWTRRFAPRLA